MGTYNKNTEVISSYTSPSTAQSAADFMEDMTSSLAKGFTANPLTSAGSPSQIVNVTRDFTGTATVVGGASSTFAVVKGGRQVTITGTIASAPAIGNIIDVNGSTYIVENYDSTNKVITLDTGYQGATASGLNATTLLNKLATITAYNFVFEGVAENRNRYSQNRVIDFIAIYPKGFSDLGITVTVSQELKQGIGTYAQLKDLEEKAYTNSNPLINYREFPFEDFVFNASPSAAGSSLLTITYLAGWGYNMMQSSQPEFLQTAIVAAPFAANADFDVASTANGFLKAFFTWYGAANSGTGTGASGMQFAANT